MAGVQTSKEASTLVTLQRINWSKEDHQAKNGHPACEELTRDVTMVSEVRGTPSEIYTVSQ